MRNTNDAMGTWGECQCDGQFGGFGGCHGLPGMAVEWADVTGSPQAATVCPSWQTNRLHFFGS